MKTFKYMLIALFSLIIFIIAFAYLQPNDYAVTRSIKIKAPADKIYSLISTPKQWKQWSVWNQRDPIMEMIFSGPETGSGAAWDWRSKTQGNGGMKFTEVIPNKKISYELIFEGMGKPSTGEFLIENEGDEFKITWAMRGTTEGNLMMKLMAPFMDKMVGSDFAAGLSNLKNIAEKP